MFNTALYNASTGFANAHSLRDHSNHVVTLYSNANRTDEEAFEVDLYVTKSGRLWFSSTGTSEASWTSADLLRDLDEEEPFFCSITGYPFSEQQVEMIVRGIDPGRGRDA